MAKVLTPGVSRFAGTVLTAAILLGGPLSVRGEEPAPPAVKLAAQPLKVPAPSEMVADVIVSGRTSTAKTIEVVAIGQQIPDTFSEGKVKNTPGFSWFVSRHYALKTDYPEEKARYFLTLMELAYPHYVKLFGAEIPGINQKRLTLVYAANAKSLGDAMVSDSVKWDFNGGGITFEDVNCAYQYSYRNALQQHQRYIVMHEAVHLYQQCFAGATNLTPGWYYEGIADFIGSHVYDSENRRLTVNVLDKATRHNWLEYALNGLRQKPRTARELHDRGGSRGEKVLLVAFLTRDPPNAKKFSIWRDTMFRNNLRGNQMMAESGRLMEKLYGPWDRINAQFAAWVAPLHNTFHYVVRSWEQDGNTLWSSPLDFSLLSEIIIYLPPGAKPRHSPWQMDFPANGPSPLVGPIARGVPEPSVGCVIDFSCSPGKGRAGLGLGVVPDQQTNHERMAAPDASDDTKSHSDKPRPGCLMLLVKEGKELVIDGQPLGMANAIVTPLPAPVLQALEADKHRIGLTAKIGAAALEITLRARDPGAGKVAEFRTTVPLQPAQRQRLMNRPVAALSTEGNHGITPYLDDGRPPAKH